jgi:hypothetical protein
MRITFVTDMGESFPVEIDPQMEIENIMALLEVEVQLLWLKYLIVADYDLT